MLLVDVRRPFRRTSGVGGTLSPSTACFCVGVDGASFDAVVCVYLPFIGVDWKGAGAEEGEESAGAADIVLGRGTGLTVWVSGIVEISFRWLEF